MRLHEKEHNVFIKTYCNKIKRKFTTTRERKRRTTNEMSKNAKENNSTSYAQKKRKSFYLKTNSLTKR